MTRLIWYVTSLIVGGALWYYFQMHLVLALMIGAILGFIITTVLKLLGWKFERTIPYSEISPDDYSDDYWMVD